MKNVRLVMKQIIFSVLCLSLVTTFNACGNHFDAKEAQEAILASENPPDDNGPGNNQPPPQPPPPQEPPPTQNTLFSDGFESGNFSFTQNSARWADTTSVSVTSANAKFGTRAVRFTYRGGGNDTDAFSELRFNPGRRLTEFSVKYYLYLPANFYHRVDTAGSSNNKGIIQTWSGNYGAAASNQFIGFEYWPTGDGGSTITMRPGRDGVDMPHDGRGDGTGSGNMFRLSERGKWIQFRVHIKLATGPGQNNGIIKAWKWVEGNAAPELLYSKTNWPYSTRGNYIDQSYILGWSNSGFSQDTHIDIDKFEFADGSLIDWGGF